MEQGGAAITETISLDHAGRRVRVEVEAMLPERKLDFLLAAYVYEGSGKPPFVHTPGVKFTDPRSGEGRDQITGDRSFHAPAVILQDAGVWGALVPDLAFLEKTSVLSADARSTMRIGRNAFSVPVSPPHYTFPAGLDLNIKSGLSAKPVATFGLMDAVIGHHIRYVRSPAVPALARTLAESKVAFAFDLYADVTSTQESGYQRVSRDQWQRFGHAHFENKAHLAMPFSEYRAVVSKSVFSPIRTATGEPVQTPTGIMDPPLSGYTDHGSWIEWKEGDRLLGGFRCAAPFWTDVIHNSIFWNQARDATGLHALGRETGDPVMVERARAIIRLCLSAPRNEHGLFHTVYQANSRRWGRSWTDPMHGQARLFLRDSECYETAALWKTAAHLLDYHRRAEPTPEVIQYLLPLARWTVEQIDERGSVPSFVGADMQPSPLLRDSAQGAAALWFLAEMNQATGDPLFLDGAKKIAVFLEREIIPTAKWLDAEQYLSCGAKPFSQIEDEWQGQWFRGNLCVIWACEGFAALHRATGDPRWLSLGTMCTDYLAFTQCVWRPPFIYTADPFGGFGVDNSDSAPMLDQRQAECVRPFLYFGRALGRRDYLERGIAAGRAGCVLVSHPRHISNGIFSYPTFYPTGLGPENIDHEAHPQCAMRTHPLWGEGSAVFTGLGEVQHALGGVYVDAARKLAIGADGVRVINAEFVGAEARLEIESLLSAKFLKEPWEKDFPIEIKCAPGTESVTVNGKRRFFGTEKLLLRVDPSGTVHWKE
jgi:hypothetical protein